MKMSEKNNFRIFFSSLAWELLEGEGGGGELDSELRPKSQKIILEEMG